MTDRKEAIVLPVRVEENYNTLDGVDRWRIKDADGRVLNSKEHLDALASALNNQAKMVEATELLTVFIDAHILKEESFKESCNFKITRKILSKYHNMKSYFEVEKLAVEQTKHFLASLKPERSDKNE